MLQSLLKTLKKEKPTGATCGYCGWNGPAESLHKTKVMNTDSSTYEIRVCPRCMRNGGIVYHADPPK